MAEKSIERSEIRFLPCSGSQKAAPSPAFQAPSPVGRGRKVAFTLAEVLITLGIIGVVAAMTLPTLVQNYKEKQTVVQLKKFYSQLEQAFRMNLAENAEDYSPANIVKYLKATKYCEKGDLSCSQSEYKFLAGAKQESWGAKDIWQTNYAKLSDGAIIRYNNLSTTDCTREKGTSEKLKSVCGEVSVDINGDNKPNVMGKDVFYFYITKKGVVPFGTKEETEYPFSTSCKTSGTGGAGSGLGCAAWVLYNENLDYTHCDGLNWDVKTTCK